MYKYCTIKMILHLICLEQSHLCILVQTVRHSVYSTKYSLQPHGQLFQPFRCCESQILQILTINFLEILDHILNL